MSNIASPQGTPAVEKTAATTWTVATVNQSGPIENGGAYVMLTDQNGAFKNTWFYVPPLIASMVNETAISAIINTKKVYVELTGTQAASSIMRFHLIG
jgi:hypothetical protein